jgi:hypothetical protein
MVDIDLQRILPGEGNSNREGAVVIRHLAGGAIGKRSGALAYEEGAGCSRLPLEDRSFRAALRVGRAGDMDVGRGGEASPRLLVSRPGRDFERGEFINGRQRSAGQYAPTDTFVLHPYGRYSNANKFAGEVDLFEALAHARKYYPIDDDRITVRGFSMGGAACWQFAVHYPDLWFAANPGASTQGTLVLSR